MPVKIVHPGRVEIVGIGRVLLASPSTASIDIHMGQIAEEAALTSRAFAVIGKLTRNSSDPAETGTADHDFNKGIEELLADEGIQYVLSVEGKVEPGVEVTMMGGKTCSDSTLSLVRSRLEKEFDVTSRDTDHKGEPNGLAMSCSRRDAKGEFLVETLRIVFGSEERQSSKEKVISVISEIADLLNGRVGHSLPD